MTDPNAFVDSLELKFPEFALSDLNDKSVKNALQSGEDELKQAFIDNKTIVSFFDTVSASKREDVLNSALIAQLAASKKFPEHSQMLDWLKFYIEVLENIGWTFTETKSAIYNSSKTVIELENAIIDILTSAFGGNALTIIKQTLAAIKSLSSTDNRFIAFERNTHDSHNGNFQIAAIEEHNGVVEINLGGFTIDSSEKIHQILLFKSDKSNTTLKYAFYKCTLNDDVYSSVRQKVISKLGEQASGYVAEIDL